MKRAVLLLAVAAACSKTPPPPEPEAPEQLETEAVLARSHAFLAAIDHDDADAIRPLLGFAFTKIDGAASERRFTSSQLLLQDLRANFGSPPSTRTYGDEKVFTGPGTATFVGASTEIAKHQDGGVSATFDFWNTLVWTKGPNGWTVTLWQVERIRSPKEDWNELYRVGRAFRHEPNPLVVAAAQGLEPGRALDVMMGQGRNAVYLASQGWKVTGFDSSDEAIRQARANAEKQNLAIDAVEAEAAKFDYGVAKWDFISLIYPASIDRQDLERIKRSLKPGGMIVIESFHEEVDDAGAAPSGDLRKTQSFATGELAAHFSSWGILRDEAPEDFADWASPGKVKIVRFVALKRHDSDLDASAAPEDAGIPRAVGAGAGDDAGSPPSPATLPDAGAPVASPAPVPTASASSMVVIPAPIDAGPPASDAPTP